MRETVAGADRLGMVPGVLADHYGAGEAAVDLKEFCDVRICAISRSDIRLCSRVAGVSLKAL